MVKAGLFLVLAVGLALACGCHKKSDEPLSAKQVGEVSSAQADHAQALAAKAKSKATDDKAKETADSVADPSKNRDTDPATGWKGPDKGWAHDWATFATGTDAKTADKGDYTLERDETGDIVAYRRTLPVAGTDALPNDGTLAAEVRRRLDQNTADSLHTLDVDAKEHTVQLRGTTKDPDEAGEAVRIALGTPGAEKVVSHLRWEKK